MTVCKYFTYIYNYLPKFQYFRVVVCFTERKGKRKGVQRSEHVLEKEALNEMPTI